MSTPSHRPGATLADLTAIPEDRRFHEVLDGELSEKAAPTFEHGNAQGSLIAQLIPSYQRGGGGPAGSPGWWIAPEIEIELATDQIVRPDIAGWRRDRCPERPSEWPVRSRPDWICEVVSSDPRRDTVKKVRIYQRAQVAHYWLVDPRAETLTALRWSPEGYVLALTAARGERVRAEPFEALEWQVGVLFGDDAE